MSTMTAGEAARRMGVKVETLYAYVSRGLIASHVAADGRTSMFDRRAVEELARRGRPRQSSRSTSLNMLIETSITSLSPQGVRYRGRLSTELAHDHTFEDVAELLWTDTLGDRTHGWMGDALTPIVASSLDLHDSIRVIVALAGTGRVSASMQAPTDVAAAGRHLIATITESLPTVGDGRSLRLTLPDGSTPIRATIAGRLWSRLSPQRPASGMLAVLNAALVLMADHELAASTLAVRVAASTRADPYAVVNTGLGVLSGPLHGAASRLTRALIDQALEVGPIRAVNDSLRSGQPLPGFGHKVYADADPRALALLTLLRRAGPNSRIMAVVDELGAVGAERIGHEPNVDFALAAMTAVGRMPPDGGETVMSIARIAGWLAHAREEYNEAPLRFRPRASYVGQTS
ncbi:MAG: citrate synthase [Ilumatobacteraceae bacterium]